jgi:hypothetical protein
MAAIVATAGLLQDRRATAPERVRERREIARVACANAGGQWVKVGSDEKCQPRSDPAKGL